MITHQVTIGGRDVSADVISIRSEQSLQMKSDPAKIDIVLCNFGNRYTGAFLPVDDSVNITIFNHYYSCDGAARTEEWVIIKNGQIQKVSYASDTVKIEATCQLGTLADAFDLELEKHYSSIKEIVEELAACHTYPSRNINAEAGGDIFKRQQIHRGDRTFLDALDQHAEEGTAVYYTDPSTGQIKFIHPPSAGLGFVNADGYTIHQEDADNAVGHRNVVYVVGSGVIPPTQDGAEIETHQIIYGKAEDADSIAKNGRLLAPIVFRPDLTTTEQCEVVAKNLLVYYKNFQDVARIKIFGKAPYPLEMVGYAIRSSIKRQGCGEMVFTASTQTIQKVMRRVIDYSKDGFFCVVEGPTQPSGSIQPVPPGRESPGNGPLTPVPSKDGDLAVLESEDGKPVIGLVKLSVLHDNLLATGRRIQDFSPDGPYIFIGKVYKTLDRYSLEVLRPVKRGDSIPSGYIQLVPWVDPSTTDLDTQLNTDTWRRVGLLR